MIEEPSIGLLASSAGLAGIIFIVMSLIRGLILPDVFSRWGATIAVVIGIILSEAYTIVTTSPITGAALLQALLIGFFGGWLSQNVNSMVSRAIAPTGGTKKVLGPKEPFDK